MEPNNMQELVSHLKENKDMQIQATTLGRFLGTDRTRVAMVLGKEALGKPVIVSKRDGQTQVLDINTGFIISMSSIDEAVPKLLKTFSAEEETRPTIISSVEKTEELYKETLIKEEDGSAARQLYEFKNVMYKSGSIEDRVALIRKTIGVLEKMGGNGDAEKVERAKTKLGKLIDHAKSKRLAPGQIPSVYEIAIWEWVN